MPGWFWILFWWAAFAGTHLVLSSISLRQRLIARLGDRGFQGLYSLIALATFIPIVRTYWNNQHTGPLLWNLTGVPGVRTLAIGIAGLGVVLLVLSFIQPSPTGMMPGVPQRARGITRITRHPLFAALGLWGLAHLLVNGFLSDVIFFGGFPVFAVIGSAHQDHRKRVLQGEALKPFYSETSLLPFAAVATGRNRLVLREIPLLGVVIGLGAAVLLYVNHARLFGP